MKSTKNRVISRISCLLIISQILPTDPFFGPVYANSTEPETLNDTDGDIALPIDPFHSLSYVPAKSATCMDNGNKAYYVCSDCGKWFEDSLGTVEITDKSSVVIHATGHTPASAVTENEVAATCEVDGSYDEVVYCSVCHAEISRKITTVPAIGHDWDEGTVTTTPTCTTDGVRTYTCKHDASHTYTEAIFTTGHTPSEAVRENEVAATCEVDGSYDEVVYCSVCHAEISRETTTVPAIGHDWDEGTVTTTPTCTTDGVRTYICKHDASHTYTVATPATGHTPSESVRENDVSATCFAAGSYDEVVYCSVCHEEISRVKKTTPIDEDAHDWGEWVQTKAPTETEPGEETRTCKNDPSHTETREIPALGPSQVEHSFLDDDVIIVVPNGATPDGSEFDVQKIVPPPAEVVEKVKDQMGASSEVLAYYEVRLTAADGSSIIHLDGEITIKIKMPEQYVGNSCVRILQEDETGKLIVMESWWEGEYLCYKTDWLEIHN